MISSATLFHFTDSKAKLLSILENEFHPRYCFERILLHNKVVKCAFPMVCFCDIPLSQIKEHIYKYGRYGIGLSKEWGRRNGLNPVFYLRSKSILSNSIEAIIVNLLEEEITTRPGVPNDLKNVIRYMKPYIGSYLRGVKKRNRIRFYDEREWRYVPAESGSNIKFALNESEYKNPEMLNQANSILTNVRLHFEPSDIKYVIVKEEKGILEMVKALREIKGRKYDTDTVSIVTSRVITCDQILKDF
jgi:hypothetical protein